MPGIADAITLMLAAYAGQKRAKRQAMMDELAKQGINLKTRELDQPDYQSFYDPKAGRTISIDRKTGNRMEQDYPVLGDLPAGFRYEGGKASFVPGLPTTSTNIEGGRRFTTDLPTGQTTEGPALSPTFGEQTGRIAAEAARTGAEAAKTGADASKQGVIIPYGSKLRLPSGEIVDNTRAPDTGDLWKAGIIPELENGQFTGKYKARPRMPQEIRAELQKWEALKAQITTAPHGDEKQIQAALGEIQPIINALTTELQGQQTPGAGGAAPDPFEQALQKLGEAFPAQPQR